MQMACYMKENRLNRNGENIVFRYLYLYVCMQPYAAAHGKAIHSYIFRANYRSCAECTRISPAPD